MSENKTPHIWYSEPYQSKKGWHVDKHEGTNRTQLNIWTEKLCWDFLREMTVYVEGKVCYKGQ